MKRTDVDFSKHILSETHYTNPITGHNLDVWELKMPNTMWYRVIFINSCNTLTIDGDYGRFSFCREFHPSSDGGVSDGYWFEKMRHDNCLTYNEYDGEATRKELEALIDGGLADEWGWEGGALEKGVRDLEELLYYVDDEVEYKYHAFRGGLDIDYEDIPYCKEKNVQLDIYFDAFDYICQKMKEDENK